MVRGIICLNYRYLKKRSQKPLLIPGPKLMTAEELNFASMLLP